MKEEDRGEEERGGKRRENKMRKEEKRLRDENRREKMRRASGTTAQRACLCLGVVPGGYGKLRGVRHLRNKNQHGGP